MQEGKMTREEADKLRSFHHRAVKAAQSYEAATPGTRTKALRESAWEKAEAAFSNALDGGTE